MGKREGACHSRARPIGGRAAACASRRLELLARVAGHAAGLEEAKEHLRAALELYRAEASRSGLASAGAALGRLLWAQTRFEESEQLAGALLEEIGGPEDVCRARLLITRGSGALGARDDFDRAEAALRGRWSSHGTPATSCSSSTRCGSRSRPSSSAAEEDGVALATVEKLATRAGHWETVVFAIRGRASMDLDDRPEVALPLYERAAEVASAHGLTESGGWSDYIRAEAYFCLGRWNEAVEAACGQSS